MKFYLILLLSFFAIKSCETDNNSETVSTTQSPSGKYNIMVLLGNEDLSENLTIVFDSATNKVSGFSGCNRFFGTYETDGHTLSFSQMGSTRKLCNPEANQLETQLLQALEKVNSFSFKDDVLNFNLESKILFKAMKNKD